MSLKQDVCKRGWQGLAKGVDIEQDWNNLKVELLELRTKFIPLQKVKCGQNKWASKIVVKRRRAKIEAWNKYMKSGKSADMYEKYKAKLKMAHNENQLAKKQFEENVAAHIKKDSKSFFAYVRSKQRTKDKVGPLKDSVGRIMAYC